MLSGFEASLGQPDSRLEFVVEDALAPTNEKVVLLVTFTGLALDIPAKLKIDVFKRKSYKDPNELNCNCVHILIMRSLS